MPTTGRIINYVCSLQMSHATSPCCKLLLLLPNNSPKLLNKNIEWEIKSKLQKPNFFWGFISKSINCILLASLIHESPPNQSIGGLAGCGFLPWIDQSLPAKVRASTRGPSWAQPSRSNAEPFFNIGPKVPAPLAPGHKIKISARYFRQFLSASSLVHDREVS